MRKIVDYILSLAHLIYFTLLLLLFHVLQVLVFNIFGRKAHQKIVEWMNICMIAGWYLTGSSASFEEKYPLDSKKNKIFIANHQSMFDTPGIIWFLKKFTPLFISKKEAARGIPSISYNLRVSKAALIDRKNGKQAIAEIIRFADYLTQMNFSAVIYPEGTRSIDGQVKKFAVGGMSALLKKMPEAEVVPIAIQNTGRFNPGTLLPLKACTKMKWTTLMPVNRNEKSANEIVEEAEIQIRNYMVTHPI